MDEFDASVELERLRSHKKKIRKRVYRRSRLDQYRGELMALRDKGATATDLQRWLRAQRIKVCLTTVTRWLDKHGG